MRVRDWMHRGASAISEAEASERGIRVGADTSLREAAERMRAKRVSELLVADETGAVVGTLRASDFVDATARGELVPAAAIETWGLAEVRVADLMTPDPRTIDIDADLEEAVGLLLEGGFRHLPVLDANQRLVGMLSERDLRGALGANLRDWSSLEEERFHDVIANVMVPGALFVRDSHRLVDILDAFTDERIGALPVLDENDVLVGILSYVDILRWLRERAKASGLELERVVEAEAEGI